MGKQLTEEIKKEIYNSLKLGKEEVVKSLNRKHPGYESYIKEVCAKYKEPRVRYNGYKGMYEYTKIKYTTDEFDKLVQYNNLETVGNIVLLNKHNADIVEYLIKNDPDYIPFAKYIFEYFKNDKEIGLEGIKENQANSLLAIIREIDRDNSTNTWRYGNKQAIINVVEYIKKNSKDFFDHLESFDKNLPETIIEEAGRAIRKDDEEKRNEIRSLASKICKYLYEYFCEGEAIDAGKKSRGHDGVGYYINDTYIRSALLFYLDYYEEKVDGDKVKEYRKIEEDNKRRKSSRALYDISYNELYDMLNKLHNLSDEVAKQEGKEKITKSELDHIIWYCYKSFNT